MGDFYQQAHKLISSAAARTAFSLDGEQVPVNHFSVAPDQKRNLKPNSKMLAHIRSTAPSFLRGLRAYRTNLSMDHI